MENEAINWHCCSWERVSKPSQFFLKMMSTGARVRTARGCCPAQRRLGFVEGRSIRTAELSPQEALSTPRFESESKNQGKCCSGGPVRGWALRACGGPSASLAPHRLLSTKPGVTPESPNPHTKQTYDLRLHQTVPQRRESLGTALDTLIQALTPKKALWGQHAPLGPDQTGPLSAGSTWAPRARESVSWAPPHSTHWAGLSTPEHSQGQDWPSAQV